MSTNKPETLNSEIFNYSVGFVNIVSSEVVPPNKLPPSSVEGVDSFGILSFPFLLPLAEHMEGKDAFHPLSSVQMQNRMAILMCNLKPAKMRGVVSQAMVMCASSPDKVEILDPPSGAVPGDRITFQGFPGIMT